MDQSKVESALDALADLGMGKLLSQVVEPVFGAVLAMGAPECVTQSGAEAFVGDYWGLCSALANAFEEPALAEKSAALFFARAPKLCSEWARSEKVEGRDRLVLSDLKILMAAASGAGAVGQAYGAALISAAAARSSESPAGAGKATKKGKNKGDPGQEGPDLSASPFAKLEREWDQGLLWPDYPPLKEVWDGVLRSAQSPEGLSEPEFKRVVQAIQKEARAASNGAVGAAYIGRLISLAAKSERGLGLPAPAWTEAMEALIEQTLEAREQVNGALAAPAGEGPVETLADIGVKRLRSFGHLSGAMSERLRDDLLLGALRRSQEGPQGEEAALGMVNACKMAFVERGSKLSAKSFEELKNMAQAGANRLDLEGGAASLGLEAAMSLYDGLSVRAAGIPTEWGPWMNPKTLGWLQERSLLRAESDQLEVSGASFAKLAARAAITDVSHERQKALGAWLEAAPLKLSQTPESLAAAASAQALATGRADSPLERSVSVKLSQLGIPAPDLLSGFQGLMVAMEAYGAAGSSMQRAQSAMATALATLEAAQLESALAMADGEPAARAPRARL